MLANFFNDSKAEAMAKEGLGDRCPWFAKEAVLKPRDSLVASPGYAFVSADYSQVTIHKAHEDIVANRRLSCSGPTICIRQMW